MSPIQLKPANLRTSVPRAKIRKAVKEAFEELGLTQKSNSIVQRPARKSAKKK